MLHMSNGFLMAGVGFSLIDILNQSHRVQFHLSPAFVVMVAFCFSMTIGVLGNFLNSLPIKSLEQICRRTL